MIDGRVLKVAMAMFDKQSKGVAIDASSKDDVMHLWDLREADRLVAL